MYVIKIKILLLPHLEEEGLGAWGVAYGGGGAASRG